MRIVPVVSPKIVAPYSNGRVYLIRYTGIAANTGLTCKGTATVCVIKQKKNLRGGKPPSCLPFNSSATVREATVCGAGARMLNSMETVWEDAGRPDLA